MSFFKQLIKNKYFYACIGVVLFIVLLFTVIIPKISESKIDEMWRTDKITISLSDGSTFDITEKEMLGRIQKYCNDGLFRPVSDENKIDGSCGIWVDFNNGTIIGMFLTRDYGYVGDTKQYIGDACYLPSGFNEFIRNLIKLHVNYHTVTGDIVEKYKLGYLINLDDESKELVDTEQIFASSENMTFSDIKDMKFEVGDTVTVYYNGTVIDSYPAQIYISSIELVASAQSKKKAEVTPTLNKEDRKQGYESKGDNGLDLEMEKSYSYDFKQIMFSDTSITSTIPNWVMSEVSTNKLYSINNIDFLVDVVALDEFPKNLGSKWTKEQKDEVYLGQGMKCFNVDDDRIFYYYPMIINNNVVGLLELEETNTSEYYASFTTEFVNGLNELAAKTNVNTPLILIRYNGNLCGIVDDVLYAENDLTVTSPKIPEITRSTIENVLTKLTIDDADIEETTVDSDTLENQTNENQSSTDETTNQTNIDGENGNPETSDLNNTTNTANTTNSTNTANSSTDGASGEFNPSEVDFNNNSGAY